MLRNRLLSLFLVLTLVVSVFGLQTRNVSADDSGIDDFVKRANIAIEDVDEEDCIRAFVDKRNLHCAMTFMPNDARYWSKACEN